jgi:hypothetical protein
MGLAIDYLVIVLVVMRNATFPGLAPRDAAAQASRNPKNLRGRDNFQSDYNTSEPFGCEICRSRLRTILFTFMTETQN